MTEAEFSEKIQKKYQNLGYDVVKEPKKYPFPFDLGNYIPDFICKKGDETLIIEIKKFHEKSYSFAKFKEITEIVSKFKGWKFIIINPEQDISINQDDYFISEKEIDDLLIKIKKAYEAELFDAGILYLWNLMIKTLINLGMNKHLPVQTLNDQNIINILYSEGEISIVDFDKLSAYRTFRNHATHSNAAYLNKEIFLDFFEFVRLGSKNWNISIHNKINKINL